MQPAATHTLTVIADEARHTLVVPHGVNLRRALVDANLSPYAALTRQLNLLVRLVTDKRIWGRRDPSRRWPSQEGA